MDNQPENVLIPDSTSTPAVPGHASDTQTIPPAAPRVTLPRHIWKKLLPFFTMTLVLVGIVVSVAAMRVVQDTRSKATASGSVLALEPGTKTAAVGDTFTLGITLNTNGDNVTAADIHITYDPTAIQIAEFTAGTQLPVLLVPSNINNGTVLVTLGAQPPNPFKGAGIIGRLTIKVLAAKTTSITFTNDTIVTALNTTGNSLANKTGSTVTVGSPTGLPKPTPTLKPTNIPGPTPTSIPIPGTPDKGENEKSNYRQKQK